MPSVPTRNLPEIVMNMKIISHAAISFLFMLCAGHGMAQSYPVKPVRIVVGFAPGGSVDINARIIVQNLAQTWGQSVVVENRAGASGTIAADYVAKSPGDGYTMLISAQTS